MVTEEAPADKIIMILQNNYDTIIYEIYKYIKDEEFIKLKVEIRKTKIYSNYFENNDCCKHLKPLTINITPDDNAQKENQ